MVLHVVETAGVAEVAHRLYPVPNIKGTDGLVRGTKEGRSCALPDSGRSTAGAASLLLLFGWQVVGSNEDRDHHGPLTHLQLDQLQLTHTR